jgi:hypothetical protein
MFVDTLAHAFLLFTGIDADLSPKNPIVFCHGLLGFDFVTIGPAIAPVQVTHWRGIMEVLQANGIEVLITRVPATSSVADRAKVLERKISEVYPGRSVHLIGMSWFSSLFLLLILCRSQHGKLLSQNLSLFFSIFYARIQSIQYTGWSRLPLFNNAHN